MFSMHGVRWCATGDTSEAPTACGLIYLSTSCFVVPCTPPLSAAVGASAPQVANAVPPEPLASSLAPALAGTAFARKRYADPERGDSPLGVAVAATAAKAPRLSAGVFVYGVQMARVM